MSVQTTHPTPRVDGSEMGDKARARAEIQTLQYIAFELGDQFYGVEITVVREIRQWFATAELPDQPFFGRGVLDIRGEIVPVYDLRARLGGRKTVVTDDHMVLILSIGGRSFGILVDAVSEIISIGPDQLRPVPEGSRAIEPGTLTNLAAHGDRMIALLDCSILFASPNKSDALAVE